MDKEKQVIDESTEVADMDTNTEQSDSTQTLSETVREADTATEKSADESTPDENSGDSQTVPESGEAETTPTSDLDAAYLNVLKGVNQHLSILQDLFEKHIARNQNQSGMFDKIYREMKEYKENTLLEAFHKPVIHSLIQLFDNFMEAESQLKRIIKTVQSEPKDNVSQPQTNTELKNKLLDFQDNLETVRFELEEVLYRLEVTPYEEHENGGKQPRKLDRKLHKTLRSIPTDDPELDFNIVDTHRIGFYWREKTFRPEEVTIFRYTRPADKPEETVREKPITEKGDETDG